MTKIFKWEFIIPDNLLDQKRDKIEKNLCLLAMHIAGETELPAKFQQSDHNRFCAEINFRDQQAVDKFIQLLDQNEKTYGTKIINIEIKDLTQNQ